MEEEIRTNEEQNNSEEEKQTPEEKRTFSSLSSGSNKINPLAILSYINFLCLVPLFAAKDDEFATFHAKQGLTLFIVEIITLAIALIPVIGRTIAAIGWVAWIILSVLGIMNVLQGKKKELPFIGRYAKNWKI